MQKKTVELISLISLSIFLLFSFIPGAYREFHSGRNDYGRMSSGYRDVNIFQNFSVLAYIVVVIVVIGIIALILQYLGMRSSFVRYCTLAPIVSAILFFILTLCYSAYSGATEEYSSVNYNLGWVTLVEIVSIVISSVSSFMLFSGKGINTSPITHVSVSKKEKDRVVILKEYKDLLDSGAITEQEYEEKKKQLLDV